MFNLILVNGPNFNHDGNNKKDLYGKTCLDQIEEKVSSVLSGTDIYLESFSSNSEDEIVCWLKNKKKIDFLLLNPGALSASCLELRNTIIEIQVPFLEIHLTNIFTRIDSEYCSRFSDISMGSLMGLGLKGFTLASKFAVDYLHQNMTYKKI